MCDARSICSIYVVTVADPNLFIRWGPEKVSVTSCCKLRLRPIGVHILCLLNNKTNGLVISLGLGSYLDSACDSEFFM